MLQTATTRSGAAAQLARDRRRAAMQPLRDLAHPKLLGLQHRDLLPLDEGQIASATGRPD